VPAAAERDSLPRSAPDRQSSPRRRRRPRPSTESGRADLWDAAGFHTGPFGCGQRRLITGTPQSATRRLAPSGPSGPKIMDDRQISAAQWGQGWSGRKSIRPVISGGVDLPVRGSLGYAVVETYSFSHSYRKRGLMFAHARGRLTSGPAPVGRLGSMVTGARMTRSVEQAIGRSRPKICRGESVATREVVVLRRESPGTGWTGVRRTTRSGYHRRADTWR